MCGILGILNSNTNTPNFNKALRELNHRGPEDQGIWQSKDKNVIIGHKRLSNLDLSDAGHQPMTTGDNRYVLAFNGEIYNHLLLREKLKHKGIKFRGHSDTEILLYYPIHFGIDKTLDDVDGMFAFALWDDREKNLELIHRLKPVPIGYG